MDCPTCGLANPPEAAACDCGYDFTDGKPADAPGWEIELAWRQKLAAFWSISWPAWALSPLLVSILTSYSSDPLREHLVAMVVAKQLAFFAIQAVLTRRLVRKNYQSFRIYVIRESGVPDRRLSMAEAALVWIWIFAPQLAFLLLVTMLAWFWRGQFSEQAIGEFASLSQGTLFLLVGPYAVDLAMRAKHPRFRLQAYGLRHI